MRVLIRYDVENLSEDTFEKACREYFRRASGGQALSGENFRKKKATGSSPWSSFRDSLTSGRIPRCSASSLSRRMRQPVIRTATTYVIQGSISDEEFAAIRNHCINPVDSREAGEEKPDTLVTRFDEPADVIVFDGFKDMGEEDLKELYDSLGLAMTFKDFLHIQNYFKGEEKRDPSMTEIRVLDTYWSDHCRHTTFSTELTECYLRGRGLPQAHGRHLPSSICTTTARSSGAERTSLSA